MTSDAASLARLAAHSSHGVSCTIDDDKPEEASFTATQPLRAGWTCCSSCSRGCTCLPPALLVHTSSSLVPTFCSLGLGSTFWHLHWLVGLRAPYRVGPRSAYRPRDLAFGGLHTRCGLDCISWCSVSRDCTRLHVYRALQHNALRRTSWDMPPPSRPNIECGARKRGCRVSCVP